MTDTALLDWIEGHPNFHLYHDGSGDEEYTACGLAAIGRGPTVRKALEALIADDASKCRGIPNAGDEGELAGTRAGREDGC